MWMVLTRRRRNPTQPGRRKAISRKPPASRRLWVKRGMNRGVNRVRGTPPVRGIRQPKNTSPKCEKSVDRPGLLRQFVRADEKATTFSGGKTGQLLNRHPADMPDRGERTAAGKGYARSRLGGDCAARRTVKGRAAEN